MRRSCFCRLKIVCSTQVLCLFVLIGSAVSQKTPVRLDSSDWWSYLRQEELPYHEPAQPIKFQNREPAEDNFQIAGITLGATWDFVKVRSEFGDADEVQRGDAASGRDQICFTSMSGGTHLIFELGEVDAVLYLFQNGPKWNGSDLCTASRVVSPNTSTASGLRLGLEQKEVRAILGGPSLDTPNKLVYYFSYRKKTSPEGFAELRKENPNMSEAELSKSFEYADVEAYIEARFASGKLSYLASSRSETY